MDHVRRFSNSPAGQNVKNFRVPQVLRSRVYLRYLILVCLLSTVVILVVNDPKRQLRAYHQGFYDGPSTCKHTSSYRCDECIACAVKGSSPASKHERDDWTWDWKRDAFNYALTDTQCEAAFTGLYHAIDESVAAAAGRNITKQDMDANMHEPGSVRAVVQDGQLYIHEVKKKSWDANAFRLRTYAVLTALNRAISSSSEPQLLPNIEFTMTMRDSAFQAFPDEPNRPIWAFARRREDDQVWVMPDFGSWTADKSFIPSYYEARLRIEDVESQYKNHWKRKYQNLFWRGQVSEAGRIRGDLIRATEHMPWADVAAVDNHAGVYTNDHKIEDYCRHTFLVVTEGRSYAGRLRYLQNCRSVIVAHKLQWITPLSHLMLATGPDQNFVQVERDWRDLSSAVDRLLSNLDLAEKIADRSRRVFGERYNTPAAEACYWRRLVKSWANVTTPYEIHEEDMKRRWLGLPFETWITTF